MIKLTHWGIEKQLHTVVETPTFRRQAEVLIDEAQIDEVISTLATEPLSGIEIPGMGGIRKMRFRARGRGKRGGARVMYFFTGDRPPVYALLAYPKPEKTDLTSSERRQLAAVAMTIKANQEETV